MRGTHIRRRFRKHSVFPLALCASMLSLTGIGCGAHASVASGRYEQRSLSAGGETYPYTVYTPGNVRRGAAPPLVVVLHGCAESADSVAAASEYSLLGDRHRFIVLYPGVGVTDKAQGLCWRGLWNPHSERRGHGDAAAIAAMTREVIRGWRIDRSRVYVIGISAGAFETVILGATYPDLYAAIGVHSGGAYMGGEQGCVAEGEAPVAVKTLARAALRAMGRNSHVMPVIVFHGDRDGRIPYQCGRQALAQWLRTDNLILRREGRLPLPPTPTTVSHASVPRGHAYTVESYADSAGCPVAQLWTVHGMGHFWSGGSNAPSSARYSDPRGPSAAANSWAFFSRWRLSGRSVICSRPAHS